MKKIVTYIGIAAAVILLSLFGYWLYYNARYYVYNYQGYVIVFDKWTGTRTIPGVTPNK